MLYYVSRIYFLFLTSCCFNLVFLVKEIFLRAVNGAINVEKVFISSKFIFSISFSTVLLTMLSSSLEISGNRTALLLNVCFQVCHGSLVIFTLCFIIASFSTTPNSKLLLLYPIQIEFSWMDNINIRYLSFSRCFQALYAVFSPEPSPQFSYINCFPI